MSRRSRRRWLLSLAVLGLLLVGGIAYDLRAFLQRPLNIPAGGVVYDLKAGVGVIRLARELADQGWLTKPRYLTLYARWQGQGEALKAGRYRITVGMTPVDLLDRLAAGDVMQYTLTLPEGIRFRDMVAMLMNHEAIEVTLEGLNDAGIMAAIGHPDEDPEGRFYPDTYRFPAATSDVEFLRRAYEAMSRVLSEEWAARAPDLPYQTAYEALIMASVIEKETGRADERARIAGVFVRRLQRGMRLQSDPTVIYGMGDRYQGRIRSRDLRQRNAYNTYRIKGLPKTPIAMPGRAAIHAALHPEAGSALYFVARGDGSHVFSDDLQAHTRAVRRYQLGKK